MVTEEDLRAATEIADYLFENGQGQVADRLVLTQDSNDGPVYLGGWCKQSVIDRLLLLVAGQREKAAKKCDAIAATYSRKTDRARIHGVAYKMAAAEECAEAIRAGDKE